VLGPAGLDSSNAIAVIGATRLAETIRRIGEADWT
jgi:hypothetical protein